ncbi:hypothetical protein K0504_04315 [Neiella marina]|uniref:DUF4935 domain-containing protein n=1 Tax=Neiella holothuriorum TaxID=2870530 RepID=A0ABS7EE97_9GAMM|nr:hypothetical protein [Neiella holothuriorum]MBW8190253.1 hypothetical protein [Neiella holothuriorum]
MGEEILAYLDHNILDSIRKGDPHKIKELVRELKLTPIYSYENLKEIKRSIGSEDIFLNLLKQLKAKFIEPILESNLLTGSAKIQDVDIFDVWKWFIENEDPMPEYGYGLTSMLEKFYGGRSDESFSDIFVKGSEELKVLLNDALKNITVQDSITEEMRAAIESLPDLLNEQYQQISRELDGQEQSPVKAFEAATGLGALVLKNIEPPNVVEKVFEKVQKSMEGPELDIDIFFGVKPQPSEANGDREKTLSEKVNGIYHQLNFLGYYRDTGMKTPRGFVRSSSDMTHAGVASFCHLLLCRDEGLVVKAAAAYEYLGVKTKIVHFQASKKINKGT